MGTLWNGGEYISGRVLIVKCHESLHVGEGIIAEAYGPVDRFDIQHMSSGRYLI